MNNKKINEQLKLKIKFEKQTHDKKLAESISPITKKLEEVDKSTRRIGEVFEKTSRITTRNLKPTLHSSQSQTRKLLSTSDEVGKTFSKTNNSKNSFWSYTRFWR